ncbi:MAG TPA: phosphate ABC transporter substrate-binding protein PstS [Candidatus Angelobacter sp.]|nr:phosphate ABC transporter substrate-binding protein PstS [Candidatus Angelobacter sp.]
MRMRFLMALALVAAFAGVSSAETNLNGAGATFPNPIYQKWFSEYHNAHNDVKINYQSIGSGGGIAQLTSGTVDFGASDGPMTDEQLAKVSGKVFHIPTVMGAVVPTYNVSGIKGDLKFSGDVLADIFLGNIKKWNDPKLAKDNPGVKFPDTDIVVVHRSEGSGTTYIFTDYLSKVSSAWKDKVGKGGSVNWPAGLGGKGNEGVAGMIKQTEGSIGYVELIYAISNKMSYGIVKNAAGNFVKASLESVTAAAASVKDMPDDFRVSITNAPGKDAYPISSFTWFLVPAEWADAGKEKAFVDFLNWMVDKGQGMTAALEYAPLPKNVAAKVKARIKEVKVKKETATK